MVWFLTQIIFILGFNCCYGWEGKKDTLQRCIDPNGKTAMPAVLTKFSFPSTNYAKFFVEIQQANFHLP
jgi:hypothetical protein